MVKIPEHEKRRLCRPIMTKQHVVKSLMKWSELSLKEAQDVYREASEQLPIGCGSETILAAIYEAWEEDEDESQKEEKGET